MVALRCSLLLLGLSVAGAARTNLRHSQEPCGNIQCPGGFVPICTKPSDVAVAGGGAWCVPDKQAVQPYGKTTHDMIATEGADPTLTAAEWAEKAKAAYAWHASGGGSQLQFVPAPPELPTAGGYHAVSTTMKCVINLTIQESCRIRYKAIFGWSIVMLEKCN